MSEPEYADWEDWEDIPSDEELDLKEDIEIKEPERVSDDEEKQVSLVVGSSTLETESDFKEYGVTLGETFNNSDAKQAHYTFLRAILDTTIGNLTEKNLKDLQNTFNV